MAEKQLSTTTPDRADLVDILDGLNDRISWASGVMGLLVSDVDSGHEQSEAAAAANAHLREAKDLLHRLSTLVQQFSPATDGGRSAVAFCDYSRLHDQGYELVRMLESFSDANLHNGTVDAETAAEISNASNLMIAVNAAVSKAYDRAQENSQD